MPPILVRKTLNREQAPAMPCGKTLCTSGSSLHLGNLDCSQTNALDITAIWDATAANVANLRRIAVPPAYIYADIFQLGGASAGGITVIGRMPNHREKPEELELPPHTEASVNDPYAVVSGDQGPGYWRILPDVTEPTTGELDFTAVPGGVIYTTQTWGANNYTIFGPRTVFLAGCTEILLLATSAAGAGVLAAVQFNS